ncbi:MAG: SPASM domain-containing protein [Bacteroidales bacterium]|jgi:radical SAM protein with 4Fe4S-binding SPASM domain|nr:SPASM domain-containing protein [Bacteroidales bacterium]
MLDIDFYMKINNLRKELDAGKKFEKMYLEAELERLRNITPIVYNIETTNACNMTCKMCPRTTMMTRSIETIDRDTFIKVIDQLKPHTEELWVQWIDFVEREYGVMRDDMSENHFFLYIISKVIQLHGYGDPLLDKNMAEYIELLHIRGFYSYFSCNPSNINLNRTYEMMDAGLDYIKYSIESVDDDVHKEIRGIASDFSKSYEKIRKILEYKKTHNLRTVLVITMLDLNRVHQQRDFEMLMKVFNGLDVYIYLKSEDQQWYRKDFHGTKSIHWSEFCKHPWMTMTIKSNGDAAMCMEDFNNEIIFGNVKSMTLYDIWNGEKYKQFRKDHFDINPNIKCSVKCDMKLIGNYL